MTDAKKPDTAVETVDPLPANAGDDSGGNTPRPTPPPTPPVPNDPADG